jgi:cobyrinic acid a,c-diamide synthase
MKAIVIAGTQSSVGKTTVSIAVMRALRNAGMDVAPFKVGPDYIDPKFHKFATGISSYNLDSWMLSENTVKYLFSKHAQDKDIAVIEGVMGLYDGSGESTRGAASASGSTAHIAELTGAPVILVMDAHGMAESAAAMVQGYKDYDSDIDLKAVILNRVSGESHYKLLKEIIEQNTGVRCLGYLEPGKEFALKSRHLGLIPAEELNDLESMIDSLAASAGRTIDMAGIEEISEIKPPAYCDSKEFHPGKIGQGLRIAIALDEAFSFYYQDNLVLMKEAGIELVEFSPMRDNKLPVNINGLYLGGGFPEEFADRLSANKEMLRDIKDKLSYGIPAYAECGGLMYLTSGIIDKNLNYYSTVDFFQCRTRMTDKLQRFGYCEIGYDGIKIRGHEFHHTVLENLEDPDIEYAYSVSKSGVSNAWQCGLTKKNVLAGYPHIHFYANTEFFKKIISLYSRGA